MSLEQEIQHALKAENAVEFSPPPGPITADEGLAILFQIVGAQSEAIVRLAGEIDRLKRQ